MSAERDPGATSDEDRRQYRPYRRFVRIVFFLAVGVMTALILRGIIRSLDRMPTPADVRPTGPVDIRALRACAEDLEKLEARLRSAAGKLLARSPSGKVESWHTFIQPFELDRLSVVARCKLDEPSSDPAVADLSAASSAIEELARSYSLIYEQHKKDGWEQSRESTEALLRANKRLKQRQ